MTKVEFIPILEAALRQADSHIYKTPISRNALLGVCRG